MSAAGAGLQGGLQQKDVWNSLTSILSLVHTLRTVERRWQALHNKTRRFGPPDLMRIRCVSRQGCWSGITEEVPAVVHTPVSACQLWTWSSNVYLPLLEQCLLLEQLQGGLQQKAGWNSITSILSLVHTLPTVERRWQALRKKTRRFGPPDLWRIRCVSRQGFWSGITEEVPAVVHTPVPACQLWTWSSNVYLSPLEQCLLLEQDCKRDSSKRLVEPCRSNNVDSK